MDDGMKLKAALLTKIVAVAEHAKINKDMDINATRDPNGKKYPARSEEKVMLAFRPMFFEHRLYPYVKSVRTDYASDNYMKISVVMEMVDLDTGYSIEFAGVGSGFDKVDKDAGKALTYAKKNALVHLFSTVTGEDTDNSSSEMTDAEVRKEAQALLDEFWNTLRYHKAAADELGVSREGEYAQDPKVAQRAGKIYTHRKQVIDNGRLQEVTTMIQNFKAELKK